MKRMKLSELTGNEILAQSLMTWDYQIILPEGAVLKKEYIDKIEGRIVRVRSTEQSVGIKVRVKRPRSSADTSYSIHYIR